MKHISLEEKAKRYDEAIEIAREINNEQRAQPFNVMTRVFPELKESGDERIRKHLISLFEKFVTLGVANECETSEIKVDDILAWLKKQESYTFEIKEGHWYKCVCDYMPNGSDLMFKNDRLYYCRSDWRLAGEIDELNVKNIGVRGYKSFFRPATNQEIKDWLEKQGEKKSDTDFSDLRTWKYIVDAVLTEKEGIGQYLDSSFTEEVAKKLQERFGNIEQKPADKVEPKFKVGDWVVSPNGVYWHIDAIRNGRYEVTSDTGECADWPLDTDLYHLWTIQDAKDGDVLSYVTDDEDLWIMIYWSLYEPYEGHVHYHALLVNDNFGDKGTCCICIDNLKPATKEQRDTLMKAMANARYTFDFEKKELKKIEQKPAWCEEDEKQARQIERIVHNDGCTQKLQKQIADWFKSLKDRVQPQPKQEWSEEDEYCRHQLIVFCENCMVKDEGAKKCAHWLKSLKERYIWKPSDEQMHYLSWIANIKLGDSVVEQEVSKRLNELLEDLKKLKG